MIIVTWDLFVNIQLCSKSYSFYLKVPQSFLFSRSITLGVCLLIIHVFFIFVIGVQCLDIKPKMVSVSTQWDDDDVPLTKPSYTSTVEHETESATDSEYHPSLTSSEASLERYNVLCYYMLTRRLQKAKTKHIFNASYNLNVCLFVFVSHQQSMFLFSYPFTNFVKRYCDHFCLCVCLRVCVFVTL